VLVWRLIGTQFTRCGNLTSARLSQNGNNRRGVNSAGGKIPVLVVTHDTRPFGFAERIVHFEDGSLVRDERTDRKVYRIRAQD